MNHLIASGTAAWKWTYIVHGENRTGGGENRRMIPARDSRVGS